MAVIARAIDNRETCRASHIKLTKRNFAHHVASRFARCPEPSAFTRTTFTKQLFDSGGCHATSHIRVCSLCRNSRDGRLRNRETDRRSQARGRCRAKNEKGERQLAPLSGITLHSGEIVRYDVTARNAGTNPAKNLVPVGTIPIGTVYEAGSASTNALRVEFSIDGGKTWSVSPMVKVRNAAGVLVEKKASPARFTAVRWISEKPLDPKSTVTYDYEVRVK